MSLLAAMTATVASRTRKSVGGYAAAAGAAIDARIAGLPGGAASMNVFSTKNHTTSTYVRNTGMWLHDLRQQLSCAVAMKTGGIGEPYEDLGGVLVTPRHILYVGHYYPDYGTGTGPLRFVLGNNAVVNCNQISSVGASGVDLCVATLSADVSALGAHVVPIWGGPSLVELVKYCDELPLFAISQSNTTGNDPWNIISDYPAAHDVMCYIRNQKGDFSDAPRNLFDYAVYTNDSGTPKFIIIGNTIYLVGIMQTAPWGSVPVYDYISTINATINAADDEAIANGHLVSRTNLTVSLAAPPTL